MTAFSTNRGRRAVRTTAALGAASLGLLSLTSCSEPTPNAHFTLGAHSESRETQDECYGHGEPLGAERAKTCIESGEGAPAFTADAGDTFRIGVDPDVAEGGWLVFLNGVVYDSTPFTSTYQTFQVDDLYLSERQQSRALVRPDFQITVAQVNEEFDAERIWNSASQAEFEEKLYGTVEGVWNADLRPQD